jgi:transposase
MLSEGATFATIRERLGTTNPTIIRWKERFSAAGIDGLDTSHPGQRPYRLTASLRQEAERWINAWELPQTREGAWHQQGFGSLRMAGGRDQTAPVGALHGQQ